MGSLWSKRPLGRTNLKRRDSCSPGTTYGFSYQICSYCLWQLTYTHTHRQSNHTDRAIKSKDEAKGYTERQGHAKRCSWQQTTWKAWVRWALSAYTCSPPPAFMLVIPYGKKHVLGCFPPKTGWHPQVLFRAYGHRPNRGSNCGDAPSYGSPPYHLL